MIGNGTESYIRILGTKLQSSDSVKSLIPEQRGCLFEDEMKMKYFPIYRDTNCGTECKINKILSLCKCVPFLFPATGEFLLIVNIILFQINKSRKDDTNSDLHIHEKLTKISNALIL